MVSPVRGHHRRFQAETPLIALCRFAGPALFGGMGMRGRKVGIVALARKLVIALWRFVEEGVIPEGAMLKV
jgi:hypothetical protein